MTTELHKRAWKAWSDAWDQALDEDKRRGRRYDKQRYAEAAHDARLAVLQSEGGADHDAREAITRD